MRVRAAAVVGMMMACAAVRGQQTAAPLSLADATTAALRQVSAFHQAQLDEAVAAEELRQARSALLPRARDSFTVTYNSPSRPRTVPPTPSFISADAIHVYQNLLGVTGELGVGLAAAVQRGRALLEAARAGTEVARRALVRGVGESYYGAALASARRGAAEGSLAAAEEFERVTELNFRAGEVPEVDVIRARLQTAARRDELLQARQAEAQANAMLSTLLGRDLAGAAAAIEPLPQVADARELDALTAAGVARRPELAQAAAQVRAARADVGVARGERLPRITYSVDRGFDTDSLQADALREHRGLLATANVDVPIFDWGASRSRQRAAELKLQAAQQEQQLTQRELALDFVTARQEAETAAARVANARNALADAERNESISVARYRAGEAPISEATDAQTTLAQQRLALQQALFDYQVARAHLREAAGE
jgi:outer membrane protein TolC